MQKSLCISAFVSLQHLDFSPSNIISFNIFISSEFTKIHISTSNAPSLRAVNLFLACGLILVKNYSPGNIGGEQESECFGQRTTES